MSNNSTLPAPPCPAATPTNVPSQPQNGITIVAQPSTNNGGAQIPLSFPGFTITAPPPPVFVTIAFNSPMAEEVAVVENKINLDGCVCRKCDNKFEFAEPNREDGTFICWACRNGY